MQPLLQTKRGELINLNTLQSVTDEHHLIPVEPGINTNTSLHKDKDFLSKAGRLFKVSHLIKKGDMTWYLLDAHVVLLCIIKGDNVRLIGNYPVHFIKLLYRYINSSCFKPSGL